MSTPTPTPVPAETPEERELRESKEKIAALEAKAAEDAKKTEDQLAKAKTQRFWFIGALVALIIGAVIVLVVVSSNNKKAIADAEAEKATAVEVAEKTAAEAKAEVERKLAEAKAEAETAKVESERKLAEIKAESEKSAAEAKAEVERKLAEAQEKATADIEAMREEMKKMAVTATTSPSPITATPVNPEISVPLGPKIKTGPVTDQEMRQLKKLLNIEGETLICGYIPPQPGQVRLPDGRMALVHPLFVDDSMSMVCQIGLKDQNIEGARASIRFHNMEQEPHRESIEVVRIVQDPQTGDRYGQLGIVVQVQ